MNSQKVWIIIAGFIGFTGVALGAFGAHILSDQLSSEMLNIYKTGVLYHLIHAIAILAIALYGNKLLYKSALMFVLGIILFSFSLYIYAQSGNKLFAMITPIGGIFLLIGWALIIFKGIRMRGTN
ncbi:MAG: DUF423 domain-containing protein [Bacteroidetes bacterium]|nr:DUF423 domain-containing protein [Bacteroidota bacterium]